MFPANNLEKYFAELSQQNWTLIPVDTEFSVKLQESAILKLNSKLFKMAGISRTAQPQPAIRNDRIFWLDAKLDTKLDDKLNSLTDVDVIILKQLAALTENLKQYFRMSLTEFECHYAVYDVGHFYKKHLDITVENNKRVFSFVIYLNDAWHAGDGGELQGYALDNYAQDKCLFRIAPRLGTMVLFKSDLEHEVLMSHKRRYSLSGWIRQ